MGQKNWREIWREEETEKREISWKEHEKDGGETLILMVNKTVSKAERTVLSISNSLFSYYVSLFPFCDFFFPHFLILTFWPYLSSWPTPRLFSDIKKKKRLERKSGAVGWKNKSVRRREVEWEKRGRLRYLALYVLAHWRDYWLIQISVKCLSLYSAVANASPSGKKKKQSLA